jgi:hypothetical protein
MRGRFNATGKQEPFKFLGEVLRFLRSRLGTFSQYFCRLLEPVP